MFTIHVTLQTLFIHSLLVCVGESVLCVFGMWKSFNFLHTRIGEKLLKIGKLERERERDKRAERALSLTSAAFMHKKTTERAKNEDERRARPQSKKEKFLP